jgi:hypothetical protein
MHELLEAKKKRFEDRIANDDALGPTPVSSRQRLIDRHRFSYGK